jgi:hypothetical protein
VAIAPSAIGRLSTRRGRHHRHREKEKRRPRGAGGDRGSHCALLADEFTPRLRFARA